MPLTFNKKNGKFIQTQQTQQTQQNQQTQQQKKEYKEWDEKQLLKAIYFLLKDIRDDIRSIRKNTYVKQDDKFYSMAELLNILLKNIE